MNLHPDVHEPWEPLLLRGSMLSRCGRNSPRSGLVSKIGESRSDLLPLPQVCLQGGELSRVPGGDVEGRPGSGQRAPFTGAKSA